MRADSIGPWLVSLSFLTWLATLTNSALVYLFQDAHAHIGSHESAIAAAAPSSQMATTTRDLVFEVVVIALCTSHGFLVARAVIRHLLSRMWIGRRVLVVMVMQIHQYSHNFLVGACTGLYKPVQAQKVESLQAKQAMSDFPQVLVSIRTTSYDKPTR